MRLQDNFRADSLYTRGAERRGKRGGFEIMRRREEGGDGDERGRERGGTNIQTTIYRI